MDVDKYKIFIIKLFKTDIREDKRVLTAIVAVVLLLIGLLIRYRLLGGVNGDFTIYISKWYDHLDARGFAGFKDNFANYNFPYLFLLYLASLVEIPKLLAVKLISVLFDFLLCYAVYALVRHVTGSSLRAFIGGFTAFLLPTVFINSAFWGQTDAIYTSFILLSLVMILRRRFKLVWLFFGIAISFKLQAIFFAPVLLYVWFNGKGDWKDPLISIATFVLLSIPPWFAGRPLMECLSVYLHQYGFEPLLSANMPNFYFWLPQSLYAYINGVGVLFAAGLVMIMTYLVILKMKYSPRNLVLFTALMALAVPYLMPQMHDRYFFLFEVMAIVLTLVDLRLIYFLVAMQFVTLNVYMKTLVGVKEMPFNVLAVVTMVALAAYTHYFLVQISPRNKRPEDAHAKDS